MKQVKRKLSGEKSGVAGQYRIRTYRAGTKELIRETDWIKNLVVNNANNGVNLIAQRLIGLTTYDIEITQAKIGTGTTPPTDADTDLETPVTSNIPRATQIVSPTNLAVITFFIPDVDLPNGTYNEFGLFCGNQLFARSLILPSYTKASAEDTTVEYSLEIFNT